MQWKERSSRVKDVFKVLPAFPPLQRHMCTCRTSATTSSTRSHASRALPLLATLLFLRERQRCLLFLDRSLVHRHTRQLKGGRDLARGGVGGYLARIRIKRLLIRPEASHSETAHKAAGWVGKYILFSRHSCLSLPSLPHSL